MQEINQKLDIGQNIKVAVLIVVYGNRWPYAKQVSDSLINDPKCGYIVIADNGCYDQADLTQYKNTHEDKVRIVPMGGNVGYGPAAHAGTLEILKTDATHVLILDDDSVPEAGALDIYISMYKLFKHDKIILTGNRVDVPGQEKAFLRGVHDVSIRGTIFEVFSVAKIANFIRLVLKKNKKTDAPFVPIVPVTAFVTGGTFLPMDAVRSTAPLDNTFFIYGEDLDYAWRLKKNGYEIYQTYRPIIHELDMTFPGSDDAHIWGLWDKKTADYKVYFRMRNSVVISRRHTIQSDASLLINIIVWTFALHIIGLLKRPGLQTYLKRSKLICRAMSDGYKYPTLNIPEDLSIPK